MMPHAIRRVFVARRARTAASIAIALLGTALLVIAAKPTWAAFLARGLPGINPAVLCTLVIAMWIVGVFTYAAARAVDEHRFAVAMSRYVMPTKDLHADVERLAHEKPDAAAREMAHRLEVRSASLPVLAAGVLLPVTVLFVGAAVRAHGWPAIAAFESMIARHAKHLLEVAAVAVVLAFALTKRPARLPAAAPTMGLLAILTAGGAVLWSVWLAPVALVVATVGLVVRKLRKERELLEAEDPAAGSEIFTIRGFFRSLRQSIAPVFARVRQVKPIWVLVAGILVIAGYTAMKLVDTKQELSHREVLAVAAAAAREPSVSIEPIKAIGPTGSKSNVVVLDDGRIQIDLDLTDDQPLVIPNVGGLRALPHGWRARTTMSLGAGQALHVSLPGNGLEQLEYTHDLTQATENCAIDFPSSFDLRAQGAPGHYTIYVTPVLTPTSCSDLD